MLMDIDGIIGSHWPGKKAFELELEAAACGL
jgi:hypothetical protein